jgi:hypothetical protein
VSDFKCDVCGFRGDIEKIDHHAASGINLCRDRGECVTRRPGGPREEAASICERRAADIMRDVEEKADYMEILERYEYESRARELRDAAHEIRESGP